MAAQKTKRQKTKAIDLIVNKGLSISDSLKLAGWSDKQARKGKAALGKQMKKMLNEALQKKYDELVATGRAMTPEETELLVRGKLVENALNGRDEAVASLKLLGTQRDVGMFNADSLIQAVIIQAPDRPVAELVKPDEPKLLEE